MSKEACVHDKILNLSATHTHLLNQTLQFNNVAASSLPTHSLLLPVCLLVGLKSVFLQPTLCLSLNSLFGCIACSPKVCVLLIC